MEKKSRMREKSVCFPGNIRNFFSHACSFSWSSRRIRELEALGVQWEPPSPDRWEEMFSLARAYYQDHGHLRIGVSYVTEDGRALGRWIAQQRRKFRRGAGEGVRTAGAIISATAAGSHLCFFGAEATLACSSTGIENVRYAQTSVPMLVIPVGISILLYLAAGFFIG